MKLWKHKRVEAYPTTTDNKDNAEWLNDGGSLEWSECKKMIVEDNKTKKKTRTRILNNAL